jgi:hypothetical protein
VFKRNLNSKLTLNFILGIEFYFLKHAGCVSQQVVYNLKRGEKMDFDKIHSIKALSLNPGAKTDL